MSRSGLRNKALRALALTLVALVVGGVFFGAVRVRRLRYHLSSAQIGFAQLESTLAGSAALASMIQDPSEFAELRARVVGLEADVVAMKELGHTFLALSEHLGWLPRVGGDIKAAPRLLTLADQSSQAALSLIDGLMPLAERLQGRIGLNTLAPEITEALQQARPQFQTARSALEQAGAARQAIDTSGLSPRMKKLVDRYDGYEPALSLGLEALQVFPALLGAGGTKSYLVLAQNSDELRATGGLVSSVGRVEVKRGQISAVMFEDSYAVDDLAQPHPQPPDPLRKYMKAGILVLRDANWWPDFPTSARQVSELYLQDAGQAADGVLAVDLTTLELIVQAMGQIEVPGYPQPVTVENLHSTLMSYWDVPLLAAPGGENADWRSHRKDFAGDLMRALLQHAMTRATVEQLASATQAIGTALAQRHMLIYVNDPATQALLHKAHWDGALRESAGDFLMIVDSNIGLNKANPNVVQTLSYAVVVDRTGIATSQLTLTYQHNVVGPLPACIHEARYGDSYQDLMERCYWDYLRVYVPLGSELIALKGSDSPVEVYEETNRTVIGTAFLLETGQARTIQLTYRQGMAYGQDSYALVVQKQPGTEALALRVTVRPPEHSTMVHLQPEPLASTSGLAIWQGVLDTDWEIAIRWQ